MQQLPPYIQKLDGDLWLTENERENLRLSYRIKEIIVAEQSPYQHVMILDSYDFGRMLVLDGVVQTTSLDGFIYNEMIAHVPLSLHPDPQHVLIIGGGDCGAAREATKHDHVQQIDLVEIDELVVTFCKEHLQEVSGNLSDPRVRFLYQDGVEFVKQAVNQYDVIIVDSSDPVGPAKLLFEQEFYRNIYNALKKDGVMVCQSQSPIFHFELVEHIHRSIKSLFPVTHMYTAVVPTYPGGLWSFTLGSKRELPDPAQLRFDIEAQYVNEGILKRCFQLPQFMKAKLSL
ncbi:polyamine aminopropyltransferase [Brevibacillus marinus]|uniref:polyamine aminopropyltransferase n=1 Tax=Brevibacillus marinus TaxID=2496837 RepID=UPI000F82E70E|nr:polyamine aminopropyltransferase [Brevibacillus marinus]